MGHEDALNLYAAHITRGEDSEDAIRSARNPACRASM